MPPFSTTWNACKESQSSSPKPRTAGILQQIDAHGTLITLSFPEESLSSDETARNGMQPDTKSAAISDEDSQFHIDDSCVSGRHVRIYTITYDDNDATEVDTLVYAEDLSRNGTFWNGSIIGRGRGSFLLSDGDVLKLLPNVRLVFKEPNALKNTSHFDEVQENELQRFASSYIVTDRLLGAGAFGKVFMTIEQTTRTQLACKVVDLRRLRPSLSFGKKEEALPAADVDTRSLLRKVKEWGEKKKPENKLDEKLKTYYREAEILASIRHPNIIGLEKVFVTENTIYMVQELVTGGDLFSYVEYKNGKLSEVEAAVVIRQIALALTFLHEKNIVHRDLKPDNILMTELSTGCRVVLTDFGAARRINKPLSRMLSVAGTDEYAAPEVAHDTKRKACGYTKAVDMWSLGCVATVLLTGASAFADPVTRLYSAVLARQCNLDALRNSREWKDVRQRPKDFVEKLLTLPEEQRMTANEAVSHDWFSNQFHRSDFDELYQRAIKHWHPRPARNDLFQFFNAHSAKQIAQSEGVIAEKRSHDPSSPRPNQIVEAHCKPFPRRMHIPIWPERRPYVGYVSPETRSAIQDCWPSTKKGSPFKGVSDAGHIKGLSSSKRRRPVSFAEPTPQRAARKTSTPTKRSTHGKDESPDENAQPQIQHGVPTNTPLLKTPTFQRCASFTLTVPLRPSDLNPQRAGDPVKTAAPLPPQAAARRPSVLQERTLASALGSPRQTFLEEDQTMLVFKKPLLSEGRFDQAPPSPSEPASLSTPSTPSSGGLKRRSKTVLPTNESSTPSRGSCRRRRSSVYDMEDTIDKDPDSVTESPSRQQRTEVDIAGQDDVTLPHHGSITIDIDDRT